MFALLRLLPSSDRDKDIEILSLRHQLAVLQRQLDGRRVRFEPVDRAWLAGLPHPLPRPTLRGLAGFGYLRWAWSRSVCGGRFAGCVFFGPLRWQ